MPHNPNLTPPSPDPTPWDDLGSAVPFLDLPTTSPNRTCGFYLREISRQGNLPAVKSFLTDALNREPHIFSSDAELDQFCANYSSSLALSPEDQSALLSYSGYEYKYINQVARGQWSYDLLGPKTPEKFAATERTIEYLLPAGSRETIGLFTPETSYNPEQREVLINQDSLSYISDVTIDPAGTNARLKMVLIPRQIYDPATR